MTGMTSSNDDRATIQNTLNEMPSNEASVNANTAKVKTGSRITSGKYDGYQEYVAEKSISLKPGFAMKATGNQNFTAQIGTRSSGKVGAWPADEEDILTVNYYDSYEFLSEFPYENPGAPFSPQPTKRIHGLQTGKKVKNLESGEFYTTAIYYDEEGRVIQTIAQDQLGGTMLNSTAYNFEGQPIHTLISSSRAEIPDILRTFTYNVTGQIASITHQVGSDPAITLAAYAYNDLGQLVSKSLSGQSAFSQTYDYNIRGWLNSQGSDEMGIFKQKLYYHTGSENKYYNGNIAGIEWEGQDGKARSFAYQYDNANRLLAAKFEAAGENNHYSLQGISYDANGNILTMARFNEKSKNTYGKVDDLTYTYESNDDLGGRYSNKLLRVTDGLVSNTHTAKDFKPNTGSQENYAYDANGNQTSNPDKRITKISYNHLNLPEEITFSTGGKINITYDAEGKKLSQTVQENQDKPANTRDYIGELVLLNGNLDYMIHEEGRVANESDVYHYDFYIKDHLGNVRQVLRQPKTETKLATMESQHVLKEQEDFSGLTASRQTDPEQNVTPGGDKVAWLNAARGRVLGPSSRQEVFTGDRLNLSVYGKYEEQPLQKTNPAGFVNRGGKSKILNDLNELSKSTQQAGAANPITILNMIGIVATDLQQKQSPEAYLLYALYDSEGNRYEIGKQPLSRKAANQHEVLEEKLYISQDGYMETVLVNETAEDVWFDDFSISRTSSIVIQETHYDPWGLELTGLGYQNGGVKENKYLYNGKELIEDNGLEYYDYGARMYDPVIGRWTSPDPMASEREWVSPYNFVQNNPLLRVDPDGMIDDIYYSNGKEEFRIVNDKPDRFFELRENSEFTTGKEAVEIRDPAVDPSGLLANNKTGYTYTGKDLKVRKALMEIPGGNVITSYMKRLEEKGEFMPLSGEEYRNQYMERYGTNSAFFMAIEEGYFEVPGFGGSRGGAMNMESLAGYQGGLSRFSQNMSNINRPGGGFSPTFNLRLRNSTLPQNQFNRFQRSNRGSGMTPSEASKEYNRLFKGIKY
jgi:RHS repeat-associated protein